VQGLSPLHCGFMLKSSPADGLRQRSLGRYCMAQDGTFDFQGNCTVGDPAPTTVGRHGRISPLRICERRPIGAKRVSKSAVHWARMLTLAIGHISIQTPIKKNRGQNLSVFSPLVVGSARPRYSRLVCHNATSPGTVLCRCPYRPA
jgi:hypothetical protein